MVFPGKVFGIAVPVSIPAVNGPAMGGGRSDRNHMSGRRRPSGLAARQTPGVKIRPDQRSFAPGGQSRWCNQAVASVSCQGPVWNSRHGNKHNLPRRSGRERAADRMHAVAALQPTCRLLQLFPTGVVCQRSASGSGRLQKAEWLQRAGWLQRETGGVSECVAQIDSSRTPQG
jgi:hypothetical protein